MNNLLNILNSTTLEAYWQDDNPVSRLLDYILAFGTFCCPQF